MNADELRAVAKEIREKADAINNKHLWHRLIGSMTDDHYLASDIAHIAAWRPEVALAVADWLDSELNHPFGPPEHAIAFCKAWRGES